MIARDPKYKTLSLVQQYKNIEGASFIKEVLHRMNKHIFK